MNLYVGNLDYKVTEKELLEIFSEFGHVDNVRIIRDKYTRRSKGYGFVEMVHDYEANRAVDNANGLQIEGRKMVVRFAKPTGRGDAELDGKNREAQYYNRYH